MILNIITTFVLGILLGMFWQSLLFFAVYTSLRVYAGGAHAATPLRCYIFSSLLTITVLLLIKFLPLFLWLILTVLFLGSAIVFILAPVESRNKPLSSKEYFIYRKRVRAILCIFILCALAMLALGHYMFSMSTAVSVGAISFMLLVGELTEK